MLVIQMEPKEADDVAMINWRSLYAGERSYSIPFVLLMAILFVAVCFGLWLAIP